MIRWALCAALGAACLALAGCGGSDEPEKAKAAAKPDDTRSPRSVGPRYAGSVVQYADCSDWKRGSRRDREATVDELRDQLTAQSSRDAKSFLSDARAYRTLNKSCSQDFASSIRLYQLYGQAQGYAPLTE